MKKLKYIDGKWYKVHPYDMKCEMCGGDATEWCPACGVYCKECYPNHNIWLNIIKPPYHDDWNLFRAYAILRYYKSPETKIEDYKRAWRKYLS